MSAEKDITEKTIPVRIKHLYTGAATLIAMTAAATFGWFSLKSDVAEAKGTGVSLERRVTRIECLMEQQTNFQIYGVKPIQPCER